MEQAADGTVGRFFVEEIGQDAVSEKRLGCREDLAGEATALLLAEAASLFGFFEKTSMEQRKMYFLTISLAESVGSVEKMAAHFGSGFFRARATVSASGSLYPLTKTMIPSTLLRHATIGRRCLCGLGRRSCGSLS
jgi:hypothetical protein